MKRESSSEGWGWLFIGVGICVALKSIFHIDFGWIFRGWWTLFILIPSISSISRHGVNNKNLLGVIIGGILFFNCYFSIFVGLVSKIVLPLILLAIGVKMLTEGHSDKNQTTY